MSNVNDLFRIGVPSENPYATIGYPRNPFREDPGSSDALTPFYTGHIEKELVAIQNWVNAVLSKTSYMPLSIVGTIGTGKSKIIRVMRSRLSKNVGGLRIMSGVARLTDTGFTRATIGGVLLASFESGVVRKWPAAPEGVIPIIWAIINSDGPDPVSRNAFIDALMSAHSLEDENEKELRARDLSLWLRRSALTPKRLDTLGLPRRIDWEGELTHIACSIVRLASQWRVLDAFFFFVDQLEDLFGGGFTDLRRSRLLTDLRTLTDELDEGTPIAVVLSWSPELRTSQYRISITSELALKYGALYDRLKRRRIDLPYLSKSDVEPFIEEFVESLSDEEEFEPKLQPSTEELAILVWQRLRETRGLIPQDLTTPRNLLGALASLIDERVGMADYDVDTV